MSAARPLLSAPSRPDRPGLLALLACLLALGCEPPANAVDAGGLACVPGTVEPCAITDTCEGTATCIDGVLECEPPAESCNGVDDDCDGRPDEDFPELGQPCTPPAGACGVNAGIVVCAEDGSGVVCEAEAPAPSDEICNGIDDDCDGQIDEGLGAARETCNGEDDDCDGMTDEGFADLVESCNGVDDDCDGAADEDFVGAEETCNGIDDDCDGSIDEGLDAARETCNGEDDDCDGMTDEGFADLVENCNGVDDDCDGAADEDFVGAEETCNGADDDCDGSIDEGLGDRACDTGQAGPCAVGIGACVGGVQTCEATVEPEAESCNGIDDDCDGSADEDFLGAAEICDGQDDDCDGQIDEGLDGAPCDTGQPGACAAGVSACEPRGLVCRAAATPEDDICNGVDDDCDEAIDEGLGGAPCETGLFGPCAAGATVCADGALGCQPAVAPADELCNGIDDDCDGAEDEGLGGEPCDTGLAGVCAPGHTVCVIGELLCAGDVEASPEACTGVDDDCDGNTDEALDCDPCVDPGPEICNDADDDCDGATDEGLECDPCVDPGPEICNGADDDCDGAADEGLECDPCVDPGPEICNGVDDDCDGAADEGLECDPCADPGPEICNGVDDDCDGAADEGLECDPCVDPDPEICNGADDDCDGAADEGLECDPCADPGPETCNGVDDDCDGATDEAVDGCDPGCDGVDDDGDGWSDEGCAEVTCGGEAPVPPCNGCPAGVVVPSGWVCIPAGEFTMGSPADEAERRPVEGPQMRVAISRPFLMMRTEVTQAQWAAIAGPAGGGVAPSYHDAAGADPCDPAAADQCPVERINWFEAAWFAHQASLAEGLEPCHDPGVFAACAGEPGAGCPDDVPVCADETFDCRDAAQPLHQPDLGCAGMRLPTEAEWEYATRAGSAGWSWAGDDAASLDAIAWTSDDPGDLRPVGLLPANPWGLFDTHGNVAEWVLDPYALYEAQAPGEVLVDRLVGPGGQGIILRGGSAFSPPRLCRSARRGQELVLRRGRATGFRLVRAVAPAP